MTSDESHLAPVDVVDRLRFERGLARMVEEHGSFRPVVATVDGLVILDSQVMAARDAESIRRIVAVENEFEDGLGPALECLALILIHDHVDGLPLRTDAYRALFDDYVDAIHRADPWQFDELRAADLRNSIDVTVDDIAAFAAATDPAAVMAPTVLDGDDDPHDDDDEDEEDEDDISSCFDEDDEFDDDHDDVDLATLRAVVRAESPPPPPPAGPRVWFPSRPSGG